MPKNHPTSFENSMMRIFAWWTTSVARAKPIKLSARNSIFSTLMEAAAVHGLI
jgi:hypothetical protein